jgi:hypothetical protein
MMRRFQSPLLRAQLRGGVIDEGLEFLDGVPAEGIDQGFRRHADERHGNIIRVAAEGTWAKKRGIALRDAS